MAAREFNIHQALAGDLLDQCAPALPALSPSQIQALRDGDLDSLVDLRPALVEWARWAMNAPDWYLDKYAYGIKVKRDVLEWLGKKALPDTLHIRVEHEVKPMSDSALAELVMAMREAGVVGEARNGSGLSNG